jgi:hypothetical protein
MKKATISFLWVLLILVSGLFILNFSANGQENSMLFPSLPDDVDKIVSFSCVPCHTSTGGLMSRSKLNFTEWAEYSQEKQKAKAEKMYSVLKKGKMPPKDARETRPEIIPTEDQIDIIKKWAESLETDNK